VTFLYHGQPLFTLRAAVKYGLIVALTVLTTLSWCADRLAAQTPNPTRYVVADYGYDKAGVYYTSRVYWSKIDEKTECYTTETSIGTIGTSGAGMGGGIWCIRKEQP
jgi:hypothetical protein